MLLFNVFNIINIIIILCPQMYKSRWLNKKKLKVNTVVARGPDLRRRNWRTHEQLQIWSAGSR